MNRDILSGEGYRLYINKDNSILTGIPYIFTNPPLNNLQQSCQNIACELYNNGNILWKNSSGKIYYHNTLYNITTMVHKNDLSQLLTKILARQIYVFKDEDDFNRKIKKNNSMQGYQQYTNIFLISYLNTVMGEVFDIYKMSGFYSNIPGFFIKIPF
ncbi:TPA: hypothetical protein R1703_000549 [Campylobacter lari]|nr:hypothetical protein [Campylobacter lari]